MHECRVCGGFFKDNTPHHTPEELAEFKQNMKDKFEARKKLLDLANTKIEEKKASTDEKSLIALEIEVVLPMLLEKYADSIKFLEDVGGLKYVESNFTAGEEDGVDVGWAEYGLAEMMGFDLAIESYGTRYPKEFEAFFTRMKGDVDETVQETTTS